MGPPKLRRPILSQMPSVVLNGRWQREGSGSDIVFYMYGVLRDEEVKSKLHESSRLAARLCESTDEPHQCMQAGTGGEGGGKVIGHYPDSTGEFLQAIDAEWLDNIKQAEQEKSGQQQNPSLYTP